MINLLRATQFIFMDANHSFALISKYISNTVSAAFDC